jgi:hypothetical protein
VIVALQHLKKQLGSSSTSKNNLKAATTWFPKLFFSYRVFHFIPCFTNISTSGIFPLILTAHHTKHVKPEEHKHSLVQHLAILWFRKMLSGQPS